MQYFPLVPETAPLAREIETIFWLDGYAPEHGTERIVPDGSMSLVIELDGRPRTILDRHTRAPIQTCRGAWLSGVMREHMLISDIGPDSRLAAVRFRPGGSSPYTHHPASRFADRVVDAGEVFGAAIDGLRARLLAHEHGAAATAEIEAWLIERRQPSRAAPAIVAQALEELHRAPAEMQFTRFVEDHGGTSYRHFVESFRRAVGTAPKVFQRILRFSQVFAALSSGRADWAALSAELGYADQAHFARDFKAFSGHRPTEFQRAGHDRLNFFPEDSTTHPDAADPNR